MKRTDLLKRLDRIAKVHGENLIVTEGGRHSKARIGGWQEPIPRHREINERTAESILKRAEAWRK